MRTGRYDASGRRKRPLLLFSEGNTIGEYLPLVGVTFEPKGSEAGSVEIILGGDSADTGPQMEHLVLRTKRIMPLVGTNGAEDGLGLEGLTYGRDSRYRLVTPVCWW